MTLRTRITLVTIIVAVLAVLVTGLVSLQLVRSSTVDQARAQLAAQATILSRIPAATNLDEITQRVTIALGDTEAGVVTREGEASGPAAELLPHRLVRRARLGTKTSTTVKGPDGPTLVEIRAKRGGGSLVLALPRNSIDKEAQGSLGRIALALLIGLAVAAVAGLLLARWLARPLVGIAQTAHRIARGERGIARRTSETSRTAPAEVIEVADALAVLDTALASSESRQREFLLSISHELRTPLTALRGYAEAISDGMVAPAELPRVGEVLVAETTRLDSFVSDLLELARLEADDFSITPERVDVAALLRASRDAWLGRAASLSVTLVLEAQPVWMQSDPRRVRQIVDGLLENALRVSPEGATVRLAAEEAAGAGAASSSVVIEVRDGGPGLSPADAEVAFERGVLRERYRDSRPVGTGLGLSIAARLASRLGGSISAGTAPAGGAVFTVTLPASVE